MPVSKSTEKVVVGIASPLEQEYVDRIAAVDPDRVDVRYYPALLPPTRFAGDHTGRIGWTRTPDQQREWREMLRDAEVLWDLPRQESSPLPEICPRLRWAQTTSAGVGPLVKRLGLAETDVIITTASGAHAIPLAEFVFATLLHHTKRIGQIQAWQREHRWEQYCAPELRGQTMTIVGPGRIGREIARLAKAFGIRVIAVGTVADPHRATTLSVDRYLSIDDLSMALGESDCVVLCCPHTPSTEGLINADAIGAMKPGVVLINIARGAVVDELAMTEALRTGQIGFAVLDVFQTEPLPADSPLWDLPNVLLDAHSGSTSCQENDFLTDRFVENLQLYLEGRYGEMAPQLDKQRGY
jgi:phosphoglycerate dehydrogenase-like enzyme